MANENNLKPIRSVSQAREKGKKGGIKSGEVRRQRKTLREELLLILEDEKKQEKMSTALFKRAIKTSEKTGNTANKAYEIIRDTIGEKPKEQIEHAGKIENSLSEEDRILLNNISKRLK